MRLGSRQDTFSWYFGMMAVQKEACHIHKRQIYTLLPLGCLWVLRLDGETKTNPLVALSSLSTLPIMWVTFPFLLTNAAYK